MSRVIGLSGPQGGGKTTLLNGLRDKGLFVDDFKVSREVQKRLGWESLETVLENPDTMMEFQHMVLQVKFDRELVNKDRRDHDIILTERTFADIASYTQLWAWELVEAKKWSIEDGINFTSDYVSRCAELQEIYSANLLLPYMPHVTWQADPHRAQLHHVEFIEEQLDQFFEKKNPLTVPVFRITEGSVQGRINQVYDWIINERD